MPPPSQIRLLTPHPSNSATRLQLTQSVTVLLVDPPADVHLPAPPSCTVLRDAPLAAVLDPGFLAANSPHSSATAHIDALVGCTLHVRPSHTVSATLLPSSLVVSAPPSLVPSLALSVSTAPRHLRKHALPSLIRVPLTKNAHHVSAPGGGSKSLNDKTNKKKKKKPNRPVWALSTDRLGTVDIALSCGTALIHPPPGIRSETRPIRRHSSLTTARVPDLENIILSNCLSRTLLMLEHVQALAAQTQLHIPDEADDLNWLQGEHRVQHTQYVGLSNPHLCTKCVDAAKHAVQNGAKWAVVVARPPAADAVWKGAQARAGDVAFTLDSAEIFLVVKSAVVVAQLRAPCDAA